MTNNSMLQLLGLGASIACGETKLDPAVTAPTPSNSKSCVVARLHDFEITKRDARDLARALRPPPTPGQAVRLTVDAAVATCDFDCSVLRRPAPEWLPAYRRLITKHSLEHHGLAGIGVVVKDLWKKHGMVKGECYAELEDG